jgi:uncharacterized protein (DUF2267 family)
VNHAEFVGRVAERTGTPPERAEILARATLETLAERLTGGEAADLAAQLPVALQDPLRKRAESAEAFGLEEFVRRVSERARLDPAAATDRVSAVLMTVREAVSGGEFEDVLSQLPQEFREPAGVAERPRLAG